MSETKSVAVIGPRLLHCPACRRETEHWVTDLTEGDKRVVVFTCLTCRREGAQAYERTAAKADEEKA
jgi:hypothetical protein